MYLHWLSSFFQLTAKQATEQCVLAFRWYIFMNSTHGGKNNNFFLRLLLRDYRFLTIIKEYLLVPINHRPGNKTVKIFKRNDSPKDALLLEHTRNIYFENTKGRAFVGSPTYTLLIINWNHLFFCLHEYV